jgi:hypothetical protein
MRSDFGLLLKILPHPSLAAVAPLLEEDRTVEYKHLWRFARV